MKNCIAGTPD
ncbi:Protein of unknown function [Bacillus toyonensis]|nr:Protein of unknown function [Bacillus toyonensis]